MALLASWLYWLYWLYCSEILSDVWQGGLGGLLISENRHGTRQGLAVPAHANPHFLECWCSDMESIIVAWVSLCFKASHAAIMAPSNLWLWLMHPPSWPSSLAGVQVQQYGVHHRARG